MIALWWISSPLKHCATTKCRYTAWKYTCRKHWCQDINSNCLINQSPTAADDRADDRQNTKREKVGRVYICLHTLLPSLLLHSSWSNLVWLHVRLFGCLTLVQMPLLESCPPSVGKRRLRWTGQSAVKLRYTLKTHLNSPLKIFTLKKLNVRQIRD